MKFLVFIIGCFGYLLTHSQENAYVKPAASLPPSLTKDADVVYRLDEAVLQVNSSSDYTLKVHQVVTLLKPEAAAFLRHTIGINKFHKVESAEIAVYDEAGKLIKKYSKKDFSIEAAFDGISLMDDNRVMKLYTPASSYPCTIDVQYKLHSTSYVELPNWYINYNNASVEHFRYEVKVAQNLDIRHRTLNLDIKPQVESVGNEKRYVWEVKNVLAKRLEDKSFEPALHLPQVEIAPNEFTYDGYPGSFRSWKDFGAWNYQFYEEKNPFNENRLQEIKSLVANAKDHKDKIRLLYQYLQQNTRYVSIQLGIGGFKPFAVKFVDQNKYGDCKALTNYMRYLLQAVGINSYPALINAGSNKIAADPEFPADPFNHVILCIPGQSDTTWLECTSTNNKAGELGTFTENKRALLLTEKGGILVNTPKSLYTLNQVLTKNEVVIDEDGGATIKSGLQSSGDASSFYNYVSRMTENEQAEAIVRTLRYKAPDALTFSVNKAESEGTFLLNRSYEKMYEFKATNKLFFPLCINPLNTETLSPGIRVTDFLFDYPYEKRDTTIFHLGKNGRLQTIPINKEIHTIYSSYQRNCSYDKDANRLVVISVLSLKNHVVPASAYLKIFQFFKEVTALEQENFVYEIQ